MHASIFARVEERSERISLRAGCQAGGVVISIRSFSVVAQTVIGFEPKKERSDDENRCVRRDHLSVLVRIGVVCGSFCGAAKQTHQKRGLLRDADVGNCAKDLVAARAWLSRE